MSQIEWIDSQQLNGWMEKGQAIIIDVREIDEYEAAHIKGSILIPLGACTPYTMPLNPDKKIVFICKGGVRSEMACNVCAKGMHDKTIYNLSGGLMDWIEQGYPVESC